MEVRDYFRDCISYTQKPRSVGVIGTKDHRKAVGFWKRKGTLAAMENPVQFVSLASPRNGASALGSGHLVGNSSGQTHLRAYSPYTTQADRSGDREAP
jgi:hypothetical protein